MDPNANNIPNFPKNQSPLSKSADSIKHNSPMQKFFNNRMFSDVTIKVYKTSDMDMITTDELNETKSMLPSLSGSVDLEEVPAPSRKRPRSEIEPTEENERPSFHDSLTLLRDDSSCLQPREEEPVSSLQAHRNILAGNSNFFYTMFSSSMRESVEKEVKIHVDDPSSFIKMVEYFYTHSISFDEVDPLKILRVAEQFDSKRLCDECCAHLSGKLKERTVCELYEFTKNRDINEALVADCLKFIHRKIVNIYRYYPRTFGYLSHDSLLEILKSDDLAVSTEYYVYEIVSTWVTLHQKSFEESKDLWDCVRLPNIDVDRLRNLVKPSSCMNKFVELQKMYSTCLEYCLSSVESRAILQFPSYWDHKRLHYKDNELCSATWSINFAELQNQSACKTFDLQGYKATIFVRRRDTELTIMFFPVYSKHGTCLKAEADLRAFNTARVPITQVLHQDPKVYKREFLNTQAATRAEKNQVTNSACSVWKPKIEDLNLIINDTINLYIQARVLV